MAYDYDFFLSYPAGVSAGPWTNDFFLPTFFESFQDEVGDDPIIYNFANRDAGVDWPTEVASALNRSKFLLAIITPPYFRRSTWCPAEWGTMLEREKRVTFPHGHEEQRLIFPVLYSGGNFPPDVGDIRHVDLRRFAYPDEAFRKAPLFMEFREELRRLARTTSSALEIAPPWEDDWPLIRRPPAAMAKVGLPRLTL